MKKNRNMNDWNEYSKLSYPFDSREFTMPFEREVAEKYVNSKKILEIGSGPCRFVELSLENGAKEFLIVDPRENTLERMKSWSQHCTHAVKENRLKFQCGLWPEISNTVENSYYDIVFSQSTLHYLDDTNRKIAFIEILNKLSRRGMFFLNVRTKNNYSVLNNISEKISDNRWRSEDGIIRTFFEIPQLIAELKESGFHIKSSNIKTIEGYGRKGCVDEWVEVICYANSALNLQD